MISSYLEYALELQIDSQHTHTHTIHRERDTHSFATTLTYSHSLNKHTHHRTESDFSVGKWKMFCWPKNKMKNFSIIILHLTFEMGLITKRTAIIKTSEWWPCLFGIFDANFRLLLVCCCYMLNNTNGIASGCGIYIYMKYPWQTRNGERESLKEKEMEWCIECRTNIEPEQKFCRVNLSTFI